MPRVADPLPNVVVPFDSDSDDSNDEDEGQGSDVNRVSGKMQALSVNGRRIYPSHSLGGGSGTETERTGSETKKKTKWRKVKSELSKSTKSISRRLKSGRRKPKDVVQEICILPPAAMNGECFTEDRKSGLSRSSSDDSLVFASRIDSSTSARSATSRQTSADAKKRTVDSSLVIYDAEYDGQL